MEILFIISIMITMIPVVILTEKFASEYKTSKAMAILLLGVFGVICISLLAPIVKNKDKCDSNYEPITYTVYKKK